MKKTERAQQVWQVLANAAYYRQTLTYGRLAKMIGMGPGTLARPLGHVMKYCAVNGLPPLTTLVVNQETGMPGWGLSTMVRAEDQVREREHVYAHDWLTLLPPSAQAFEDVGDAYEEAHPKAG